VDLWICFLDGSNNMELMSTRLKKLDVYDIDSLSGLARQCNWFINGSQILKNNIQCPRTIFITAYRGNEGILHLAKILDDIPSRFALIIASEDVTFPAGTGDFRWNVYAGIRDTVNFVINHSKVIHIFVENLDTLHDKLTPIPLGIHPAYEGWYTRMFNSEIVIRNDKGILAFCCHRLHNDKTWPGWKEQFLEREIVSNLSQSEWKNFVEYREALPLHEFKDMLLHSKFTLCPHGGGIDPSPRCWEALLCGSIPIITHSTLDEAYSRFPVFYINKWEQSELDENKLNLWWNSNYKKINWQSVRNMLSFNYWQNLIRSKAYADKKVLYLIPIKAFSYTPVDNT
jgi:hypothetical protein